MFSRGLRDCSVIAAWLLSIVTLHPKGAVWIRRWLKFEAPLNRLKNCRLALMFITLFQTFVIFKQNKENLILRFRARLRCLLQYFVRCRPSVEIEMILKLKLNISSFSSVTGYQERDLNAAIWSLILEKKNFKKIGYSIAVLLERLTKSTICAVFIHSVIVLPRM